MTEKKQWFCEICTQQFEGRQADAHVEIFLNTMKKRNTSAYVDQYYSDIARLGMCYQCLKKGLDAWGLLKIIQHVDRLESGELIAD